MDGDVETHELDEGLVVTEAEESRQVPGVVLVGVDGGELALAVDVAEDTTGDVGELGDPELNSATTYHRVCAAFTHRSMQSSKTGPQ